MMSSMAFLPSALCLLPSALSPRTLLIADDPDAADEQRVLVSPQVNEIQRAWEKWLIGPVAPELTANQEPIRELVLSGDCGLLQQLIGSAEQPLVVETFVSNTHADRRIQ